MGFNFNKMTLGGENNGSGGSGGDGDKVLAINSTGSTMHLINDKYRVVPHLRDYSHLLY